MVEYQPDDLARTTGKKVDMALDAQSFKARLREPGLP